MDESRYALPGVEKIQRGPLREQVRAQIKQLILTNQLRPGQPIVIDRLASELGVSHTPVREALAMLQHDGLVVMRPYENPRVAGIEASDVREAWDMRLLLEGWAINEAALKLPEDALGEIANALACAREDAEESRYDSHLEADFALHELILRATDNRLFQRLARMVNDQSIRIRWLVETIAPTEEVLAMIDEHCGIVQALKARDQELAYRRLIAHLEGGRDRTLRALEKLSVGRE
jgi:DNA-binding GntR family transcriptional regulator